MLLSARYVALCISMYRPAGVILSTLQNDGVLLRTQLTKRESKVRPSNKLLPPPVRSDLRKILRVVFFSVWRY